VWVLKIARDSGDKESDPKEGRSRLAADKLAAVSPTSAIPVQSIIIRCQFPLSIGLCTRADNSQHYSRRTGRRAVVTCTQSPFILSGLAPSIDNRPHHNNDTVYRVNTHLIIRTWRKTAFPSPNYTHSNTTCGQFSVAYSYRRTHASHLA
jgi:hypothetical protein